MKKPANSPTSSGPVPFIENCGYNVDEVAAILRRHPKTIRQMCRRGVITARCDRGGFTISGWAIRAYLECRSVVCQ